MRLNTEQMVKFICELIPVEHATRIALAHGDWADLFSIWDDYQGWELRIVTNKPERVGISQIYEHFRRQETCTEWQREIGGDMAQSKVQESVSPTDGNCLSLAVGRIELGLTEIKAKLDSLDHLREMTALQEDDPSFTVKQVAMKLQVSPSKVYHLTESGKLKSYKTGNQVRIKASHVREYQDGHTRHGEAAKKSRRGSFNRSEADRIFGPGWDS